MKKKMEPKKGEYVFETWGYDQTQVDFAKIISVSKTGKSIVCRRVKVETRGHGVLPTDEEYGERFRLYVREHSYVGTYPYCRDGKRKGYFMPWDGRPKYESPYWR